MLPKIASTMLNAALWYRYVEEEFVNKDSHLDPQDQAHRGNSAANHEQGSY
jgi:hypothetical protein